MKVPDVFKALNENQPAVMNIEAPVHYNDVRLVVPLADPATGALRDTIVANMRRSRVFHNRQTGEFEFTRYIDGTDTAIPWPAPAPKEEHDMPGDTRIMDVEALTYVPTLLTPPFPQTVIDELRNKYSKFRTRHEPEHLLKVRAEDAARAAQAARKVLTPVQELNRLRRKELRKRGPPVMTAPILEQLGRLMAEKRPDLLAKVRAADAGADAARLAELD